MGGLEGGGGEGSTFMVLDLSSFYVYMQHIENIKKSVTFCTKVFCVVLCKTLFFLFSFDHGIVGPLFYGF